MGGSGGTISSSKDGGTILILGIGGTLPDTSIARVTNRRTVKWTSIF